MPEFTRELDEQMMARAIALAEDAAKLGEVPIAAVIYNAHSLVIAEAHNRRELDQDPTAHAEILAIRAAAKATGSWRLESLTLAVTLEPCAMCAGAIVLARLPRLVYAASDPKAGACNSLMAITTDPRLNHRVTPITGVMADQASAQLRAFFKTLRA
jgi:tRNA(adenine34) deaminase